MRTQQTKTLRESFRSRFFLLLILAVFSPATVAIAQTSSFTYQGRFTDGGTAATGTYDMQFKLFDTASAGSQIGSTITNGAVLVNNGVFTVQLDYGAAAFSGADRYLEIGVRVAGDANPYTILAPRQQLTSAVYAIRAGSATNADTATNASTATNATQLGGVAASQYVQTSDTRLSDARVPTAGSNNYIQNTENSLQVANFNITGNGLVGGTLSAAAVNANAAYYFDGRPVLSTGKAADNNTFTGFGAGKAYNPSANGPGINGKDNSFFGFNSGVVNTTGQVNSFFGSLAGSSNTTGSANSFFGGSAGASNITGHDNSFFGVSAGAANTTGFDNSFFGRFAGQHNTSGDGNSFFGREAGTANTSGFDNSFFGRFAGASNTTGQVNSFFGEEAGKANTTGSANAFFGFRAGMANTTGDFNTFLGRSAGEGNETGKLNSFIGVGAGASNTKGDANAFLGVSAGKNNTTGGQNTFVGANAGFSNQTGSYLTLLGAGANVSSSPLTNATAIGAHAEVTKSNSLVLGSLKDPVSGFDDTNVGIGTTAPNARFHIATNGGNIVMGDPGCVSGYTGIGFGSSLSNCGNYSLVGNGMDTIINRPTGGRIYFREDNATQMVIAPGGVVGIVSLGSEGSIQLCRNASNQISNCSSSLRYKKNIRPFFGGLSVLNRLRPITFDWKQGGMHDLGFGAEDIAAIEPLLVTRNDKGEIEGVKYDRITAVLVNAVKEQQEQIKQQQSQIQSLKKLVCQRNRRAAVCR